MARRLLASLALAAAAAVFAAGCSWLVGVDGDPVVVDLEAGDDSGQNDGEAGTDQ